MRDEQPDEFVPDPYFEKLLRLKESDPAKFYGYPEEVRVLVEQYEVEKGAAAKGKRAE